MFTDRLTSTSKGWGRRPGEAALVDVIRRQETQKVMIVGLDGVGRSLVSLMNLLETNRTAGVSLWLVQERLDTETGNGLSLFEVAGMMAQHLRQSRRDRILRGQAAARSLDVRFGRPPIPAIKVEKAKQYLASGKGVRQAARFAGISPASVSRLKSSLEQPAATI